MMSRGSGAAAIAGGAAGSESGRWTRAIAAVGWHALPDHLILYQEVWRLEHVWMSVTAGLAASMSQHYV